MNLNGSMIDPNEPSFDTFAGISDLIGGLYGRIGGPTG